jgi:uncharacterized OB-fold protein
MPDMTPSPQLLPDVDDPLAAPFWAATRAERLVVQRCDSCGAMRWPPLAGCPDCRSRAATWVDVATTGTVWSYAVYHRALHGAFSDVPYTIAVVDIDNGPRMTARAVVGTSSGIEVGARVVAAFDQVADGVVLPRWEVR